MLYVLSGMFFGLLHLERKIQEEWGHREPRILEKLFIFSTGRHGEERRRKQFAGRGRVRPVHRKKLDYSHCAMQCIRAFSRAQIIIHISVYHYDRGRFQGRILFDNKITVTVNSIQYRSQFYLSNKFQNVFYKGKVILCKASCKSRVEGGGGDTVPYTLDFGDKGQLQVPTTLRPGK